MDIDKERLKLLIKEQIINFMESVTNNLENNVDDNEKDDNKYTKSLIDVIDSIVKNAISNPNDCSSTIPSYTLKWGNFETCHGCKGKGWVNCEGIAQKCPVCNGKGGIYSEINDEFNFPPLEVTCHEEITNNITTCRNGAGNMCH